MQHCNTYTHLWWPQCAPWYHYICVCEHQVIDSLKYERGKKHNNETLSIPPTAHTNEWMNGKQNKIKQTKNATGAEKTNMNGENRTHDRIKQI